MPRKHKISNKFDLCKQISSYYDMKSLISAVEITDSSFCASTYAEEQREMTYPRRPKLFLIMIQKLIMVIHFYVIPIALGG